jgi:oxalate decarboxylase
MERRPEHCPYTYVPQPIRDDGAGGIDFGPRDVMRDLENPDMLVPTGHRRRNDPQLEVFFLRHQYAVKSRRLVTGSDG